MMKPRNIPMIPSVYKGNRKNPYLSARSFLIDLPSAVEYAIERGLPEIDQPLISDLDLVITKRGFLILYHMAVQHGMVVSVTLSYGGARLFIAFDDGGVKRFDCMWGCSYMGIPICNTRQLLATRQSEKSTGLVVLAEDAQAKVAFAVKNAHGGAEKYRSLLEQHGLEVLNTGARRRWLASQAFRHPFITLTGVTRMVLAYAARIVFPSGIKVFGASAAELRHSDVLCYLFQDRIREAGQIHGFIRSRLGSELCVVRSRTLADIDLSGTENLYSAEQAILIYLYEHQSHIPQLIMAVS